MDEGTTWSTDSRKDRWVQGGRVEAHLSTCKGGWEGVVGLKEEERQGWRGRESRSL